MKNRAKALIINLLIGFTFLFAFVLKFIFYYESQNETLQNLPLSIFLCLIGFIIGYILAVFVHELGHIVFAKKISLNVKTISFFIFNFDCQTKKLKINSSKNAGESQFTIDKKIDVQSLANLALGGLVFSILYYLLLDVILIVVNSMFLEKGQVNYLIFAMQNVAFYIFFVNVLPIDKDSDGSIAFFTKRQYNLCLAQSMNLQFEMQKGTLLTDLTCPSVFENSNQPIAVYYKYLFMVANDNKENAFEYVYKKRLLLNECTDNEYIALFPQVVYSACKLNKDKYLNSIKEQATQFFENYDSIDCVRSHYQFRLFYNETKWSEVLKNTYEQALKQQTIQAIIQIENKLSQ